MKIQQGNKIIVIGAGYGISADLVIHPGGCPQDVEGINYPAGNGFTHVLYRADSPHNAIFVTERCNSNCIMCSQPPQDVPDGDVLEQHLRLIDLIPTPPSQLGITGGEPTLLKDGLVQIVSRLNERFPATSLTMLSNGRMYSYEELTEKLANIGHSDFLTSIPLYANNASDHDYIVQSKGAFDQTIQGLYNAEKHGLAVEIRVVLHKQTIPGLVALAEFIYRNLPFVRHVALMGLENMGYVRKNWEQVWIDPIDYAETLEATVRHLFYRGIAVSLYNLPLCVLPNSLWYFARQSISDYKNIYLSDCDGCSVKQHCGGLFKSSETRHSRAIRAIASLLPGGIGQMNNCNVSISD
ncbi:MAG: His-Xaa-Ser system radical SAM maturase HxsC [Betaproteobacteria bacterium]